MKLEDLSKQELENTMGVCEHCSSELGEYVINPYDQDIHGEENWEYICDNCYHEISQDI